MINYLALLVALAISMVAGYFSIIGLTAIFAGAFWPVIIMGSVLEVGKLVTASWLYRNWYIITNTLRVYLTTAVVLLMLITSMGIFGFLSRAHIEQQLASQNADSAQVEILDSKIAYQQQLMDDVDKQVKQIDDNISKMTQSGQTKTSLKAIGDQRKTRDGLVAKKDGLIQAITQLKSQKIEAEAKVKKIEAEVGPIKYIADMIYDSADTNQLEKAVRLVIILLVIVFDPLAVVLLIAANIGLTNSGTRSKIKNKKRSKSDRNVVKIDKSQIARI